MLNTLAPKRLQNSPILRESPGIAPFIDDVMKARAFERAADFRSGGFWVLVYVRSTLNGMPEVEHVVVKEVCSND